MSDAYRRYADGRQQAAAAFPIQLAKRHRTDYDIPSGHELSNYYAHEDERAAHRVIRDTDPIGASYDRYLRSSQMSSYAGSESARALNSGLSEHPVDDPRVMGLGASDPAISSKGRGMGAGGGRSELPLPPDASSTLFVEGLPTNCTRREVSHIFRPFVGYKEVRLVTKESRHSGGDPLVLCFVDFVSPAHAATAMDALQAKVDVILRVCLCTHDAKMNGVIIWEDIPRVTKATLAMRDKIVELNLAGYKFDEHDRDSVRLRLQFARYPGARSGGGHRGKR